MLLGGWPCASSSPLVGEFCRTAAKEVWGVSLAEVPSLSRSTVARFKAFVRWYFSWSWCSSSSTYSGAAMACDGGGSRMKTVASTKDSENLFVFFFFIGSFV